jgi:hypothetical protein
MIFALVNKRVTLARQSMLPKQGQKGVVAHARDISRTHDPYGEAVSQQPAKAMPLDS